MENFNQYAAPRVNQVFNATGETLTFKELKQLYSWSRSIGALMVLYLIIGLVWLSLGILTLAKSADDAIFLAIFGGLFAILGGLLFVRNVVGRYMGIALTGFSSLGIFYNPLAGIIAIWCCYIFVKSKMLFGEDRLTHKEVKARFKAAKLARKGG